MSTVKQEVINQTISWISDFVVDWNICPFARSVLASNLIRFSVSVADGPPSLLEDLAFELKKLAETEIKEIETTLLIHPFVLNDFHQYNDFLDVVDQAILDADMSGIIQVASFHPDYQFAGSHPDAIENFTNRSPYPMLHLLREASVDHAVATYPDVEKIPERNIRTLRERGLPERSQDQVDGRG
ncbi:MAG: DUF1415 domain-containing protein [Candidatus Latescibacteria bacterium]|nr:DUF1415 domain-containing protein [Candidatus Latescibacterota bacterium]